MDKQPSTFSKITKVVVWIMLLAIIGGAVFTVLGPFG
ncbi:DUF4044 domain-containing protein [Vagococcus penaei]|uniref:Uncharacterized protein n=1 Tax=Vagococcus penaei TaxID=633807 RepID=A0A1Q2D844_9ENTE|nr:DUF4044 domain-containing protein [Vagococcus penaei]AQP54413.1 hypothetical protein BW732_09360 [Vagococcus penaei]RSU06330.1 DUF4044 domain-containing protein [Vagococcus penaei]